jgi:hypothetical protein
MRLTNQTVSLEVPLKAHKYFAFLTVFCMAMTFVTGFDMVSGKKN